MALNKQDLDAISQSLLDIKRFQSEISSDFNKYVSAVKKLGELQENINHLQSNIPDLIQKAKDAVNKKVAAEKAHQAVLKTNNKVQIDLAKEALELAEAQAEIAERSLEYNKNQLIALNHQQKTLSKIVKEANLANLAYVETGKVWNKLPRLASNFYREIRNLAAVQMSKDIKQAELSMGILGKQSQFFSKGISKASESTIQLGFGISDIAKSQAAYSEEIGRSSMLTELGMRAMAEMAKGTTLGVEGAAAMAADMERFGISVEGSRNMVQETVDIAAKMGVNSTKAIKELTKNLKVAQTFHFKGGVRGMAEMANYAAKMKIDMAGISAMADKVFRPEGAVEMAARLQTMGGAFARLGNPFELMFKARNDFGAFTKDVAKATAELAQFNESTGEFEIGGLQLDRLREISAITGIGADQLSEMAKQAAKFNRIKSFIPSTFSMEDQELISSLAEMKDGQYMINIDGKELALNQIQAGQLKLFKEQKKDLAERAKQAQTFDDAFNNLVNQFKSTLLPFVENLNKYFVPALIDFQKKLIDDGWIDKMKSIAADVGSFVVGIGKFATSIIDTFGVGGTLIAAGLGTVFFNGAKWYAQGVQLGMGFNSVTMAGSAATATGASGLGKGVATSLGMGGSVTGNLKSAGAIGGGILSAGLSGYNEWTTNAEKGKSTGENVGRTTARAAGAGLGAWGGAAAGAAIGSVVPVVGTAIGGIIGGIVGGMGGDFIGDKLGDAAFGVDDAVIKFNPQDKVVSMSDGMVASTNKGKIDDLVGGSRGGSVQKIEFGKLEITGTIQLEIPGSLPKEIDLANEPEFVRKMSTLITQQLRINASGGKLSPNMY
jgi:hypothetical protein